jgi:hypothetical protein
VKPARINVLTFHCAAVRSFSPAQQSESVSNSRVPHRHRLSPQGKYAAPVSSSDKANAVCRKWVSLREPRRKRLWLAKLAAFHQSNT